MGNPSRVPIQCHPSLLDMNSSPRHWSLSFSFTCPASHSRTLPCGSGNVIRRTRVSFPPPINCSSSMDTARCARRLSGNISGSEQEEALAQQTENHVSAACVLQAQSVSSDTGPQASRNVLLCFCALSSQMTSSVFRTLVSSRAALPRMQCSHHGCGGKCDTLCLSLSSDKGSTGLAGT